MELSSGLLNTAAALPPGSRRGPEHVLPDFALEQTFRPVRSEPDRKQSHQRRFRMLAMMINVFGGLAIFIFGMKMMSDGLHCVAGERMRSILRLFSANRFVAILSGTAVTAVIQSSSASTVMVIGFVNAGLLTLVQAIGIIFGANIGTTVTAQLVAFDISWIIMPAIILGLLAGFVPRPAFTGWGTTIIGLGFLFLGMMIMSGELKQLSEHPAFMAAFQIFDCAPVNGWIPPLALFGAIAVGMAVTLVIQSSSACSGIIIALGASGLVNLYTAVALVLGSNIGTTITAQLAAIPANRVAKQAALAHTLFNVIGVLIICATFWIVPGDSDLPVFFRLVDLVSTSGDLPRQIANAHTIFNVCTTLILTPFIPLLAKICERIIPAGSGKIKFQRLEPHLLDTPEIALTQTVSALRKMLKKAWKMADGALKTGGLGDGADRTALKNLDEREARIDLYQHDITAYLSQLMLRPLSSRQAARIPKLIHCTNDAERIGDHTVTIRDLIREFKSAKGKLSQAAETEFRNLHRLLSEQADNALQLLEGSTPELQTRAVELEKKIILRCDECEHNHLKRLTAGQCHPATGVFYLELVSEVRKISRHFANIAERAAACRGAAEAEPESV